MGEPIRGIIEGFYGTPWTWEQRTEVCRHLSARGMTHYVYAPKDDPKHRDRWRSLYRDSKLAGFDGLVRDGGMTVGYAIAPGLDIDFANSQDRRTLNAKVDQLVEVGVSLVVLALDDIDFDPDAGPAHAELTAALADHLAGRARLAMVPTEYVGMAATPYLRALASGIPPEVEIGWTGPAVVCDTITAAQAEQRAGALGGRAPLLWDNYPVNDGLMADRLFMGPLWGREPALVEACSGYLANPMTQARCSLLPLASAAGWLRGEDPLGVWAAEAGPLRVFAEACDGSVPQALAARLAETADGPEWAAVSASAAAWLADAAVCDAPGLEGEADEWVAQVHREARLALSALRLIQHARPYVVVDRRGHGRVVAPDVDSAQAEVFNLAARWPRVRRGTCTVMGQRCGFRPLLAQRADGAWLMERDALEVGHNATDAMVGTALDSIRLLASQPSPVELLVDGEALPVDDQGRFRVPIGVDVVVLAGAARTVQRTPCGPPVPAPTTRRG